MTARVTVVTAAALAACVLGACGSHSRDDRGGDSGRSASTVRPSNAGAYDAATPETRILSRLHAENQEEIRVGQLAQRRAASAEARQYGQHLIQDHTDADDKVMRAAREMGIQLLPADEIRRAKAREMGVSTPPDPVAELGGLSGEPFDRTMAMRMQEGHRLLIQRVERARGEVRDARVRAMLDEMLPTLRMHEQMAAALATGDRTRMNMDHGSMNR